MRLATAAVLCAAAAAWAPAHAQSVALQGMLGSRVLLVVDGSPKTMAAGETFRGVKLLSSGADEAVVEAGGKRLTLRMGETPGRIGPSPVSAAASAEVSASAGRVVMTANRGGHFMSPGLVNGRPVTFMVDTGATMIAMGMSDADRMGIEYKAGRPVQLRTANGLTVGYLVRLATVKVGEVELYDQEAVVSEQPMPYLLLGNSVLNRFTMRRDHQQMVLERR